MDRSHYPVRKERLAEEGPPDVSQLSPAERVEMVWTLTLQAWEMKEGKVDELRVRRDVVRVAHLQDQGS